MEKYMKIFNYSVLGIIFLLITLFFYQNWSRTISMDKAGNSLSFDLQFWGLAWPGELSASVFALIFLGIGILIGLILPFVFKLLFSSAEAESY